MISTSQAAQEKLSTSQVASKASAAQAAWEAQSCAFRHQHGVEAAAPHIEVGVAARGCSPSHSACWGGKCMRRVPGWCRWGSRNRRMTCTGWSWCGLCRSSPERKENRMTVRNTTKMETAIWIIGKTVDLVEHSLTCRVPLLKSITRAWSVFTHWSSRGGATETCSSQCRSPPWGGQRGFSLVHWLRLNTCIFKVN